MGGKDESGKLQTSANFFKGQVESKYFGLCWLHGLCHNTQLCHYSQKATCKSMRLYSNKTLFNKQTMSWMLTSVLGTHNRVGDILKFTF